MEHQRLPVSSLEAHKKNYRSHPPEQIKHLVASLQRFQQVKDIVVRKNPHNERYTVLAGHGVVEAARECYMPELRCVIVPESWSEQECEAYLVADNNLSNGAMDDEALLAQLLTEQADAGFDLASLGSDEETLRQMLQALGDEILGSGEREEGDGGDEFDITPEEGPTRTHVGELWQLGEHRLLVGDSTDPQQVARLMQGERCKLIFCDPPYGVSYSGLGQSTSTQTIENDDLDPAALRVFLLQAFKAFPCDEGCNIYICHDDGRPGVRMAFEGAFLDAGYTLGTTIIWAKNNAGMGWQDYRRQHEPILFGWNNGHGRVRVEDRSMTTLWQISRDDVNSYQHLTQKPVALPALALTNSSERGAIVYDGFGGSGSTLIACQRTGRKARLIELEPKWADVILRRYEAETGQTAQLLDRMEVAAHG